MLALEECLEEAKRNMAAGKDINLRNAVRSLADFARIALAQLGVRRTELEILSSYSIRQRYRILSRRIPELTGFEELFEEIEEFRQSVDHNDKQIPKAAEVSKLIVLAARFKNSFLGIILPPLPVRTSYQCKITWVGFSYGIEGEWSKRIKQQYCKWIRRTKRFALGPTERVAGKYSKVATAMNTKYGHIIFDEVDANIPDSANDYAVWIEAESPEAIDAIVSSEEFVLAWSIVWTFPNKGTLTSILERAQERTGRTVVGLSGKKRIPTSIEFDFFRDPERTVGITFEDLRDDSYEMSYYCPGYLLKSMKLASSLISPRLCFAAFYDEVTIPEFRTIVLDARGHDE